MYVMDININYLRNKNKQMAAIQNNAIIFDMALINLARLIRKIATIFWELFKETFQTPHLIFKDHLPKK